MKLLYQIPFQLFIICFLTILTYSNIFQNTYIGDDQTFLVDWEEADHLSTIPALFTEGIIANNELATYRPIRSTIIVLFHQLTGTNPFGFHLYSLFVLLATTVLVYFITREIVSRVKGHESSIKGQISRKPPLILNTLDEVASSAYYLIPFLTALLFGLHPIHTEAITFMLGAIDSTGVLFLMSAFYFYLLASKKPKTTYYLLSLFFSMLAFFTNEITLVLPLLILIYDFIFKKLSTKELFSKANLKKYLPYFFGAAIFLIIKIKVVGFSPKGVYLEGSFYLTMLTMVKGVIKYLNLLIWPVNLSPYPQIAPGIESYTGIDAPHAKILSQSLFNPDILFYLLLIGGSVFFSIRNRKSMPLISFSVLWFFIGLLPVSNIIPLNAIIQERYLFLSSFAFCLLIGWVFCSLFSSKLFKSKLAKLGLTIAMISYLGFFMYQTYLRNEEWKSPATYWTKTVSQVPMFFWANVFLANSLANEGDYDKAAYYYQKALEIRPDAQGIKANIEKIYQLKLQK